MTGASGSGAQGPRPDAAVIGAGCAGLSAAAALAAAGLRVLVLEARPVLGGRTFATRDAISGDWVDNGQHVLLGCYHETRAYLRRLGVDGTLAVQSALRVAMVDRYGRVSELCCPALPAPINLLGGVLAWSGLTWPERLSVLRLRSAVAPGATPPPSQTVREWLQAHGQAPRLCELLWEPLALAALNQPIGVAAAAPFVEVVRRMLGPGPDDSALIVPTQPLTQTFVEPAVRFVTGRGGEVQPGAPARVRWRGGAAVGVTIRDVAIDAPIVISTVPWHAVGALCGGDAPPLVQELAATASRMTASPIVTANLWFDRPVLERPLVGLPGRTFQWAFDRAQVTPGAAHLSLVSSGADAVAALDNDAIVETAHRELRQALPLAARARLVRGTAVRDKRATFSLAPGEPARPAAVMPAPGFFLAGDWVDTGLPATIESAVVSGHRAAAAALRYCSVDSRAGSGSLAASR